MPQLDVGSKEKPIRAWFPPGCSYATGVYNTASPDLSVELHVSMTADDHGCVYGLKDRQEAVLGCQSGEDLVVVSRCSVAEQHLAQTGDRELNRLRPITHEPRMLGRELLTDPANRLAKLLWNCTSIDAFEPSEHFTLAVA